MIEAEVLLGGIKFFRIEDGALDIVGQPIPAGLYQQREYTMKYATLHNMATGRMVSTYNGYIKGIDLNPEWLQRFNFEKQEDGNFERIDKNGHWTVYMDEDVPYMSFGSMSIKHTYIKVKLPFVHNLQALYSSMTTFELHDLEQMIK